MKVAAIFALALGLGFTSIASASNETKTSSSNVKTTHAAPPFVVKQGAVSSDANGSEPMALAKKYACIACHSVDKKLVGPAWKSVAEKYRNVPAAQARLEAKISKGGKGVWGNQAMPPNSPRVPDADIVKLANFILSL